MFNNLFGWLGSLVSAIGGFFKRAAQWLMKHIIRHIIAVVTAAYEILDNIVGVLIKALKRIKKWYFDHVYKIQKKILDVVSAVRVGLSLLRLLDVKWAVKLDKVLQEIQAIVTESIVAVVSTLNTAMSYLGLIVSPGMVIRKDFWAASLWSSLGATKRAAFFGANNPLSATDQQAEADSATLAYQRAPLATLNADGTLNADPAYQGVLDATDKSTADYLSKLQ